MPGQRGDLTCMCTGYVEETKGRCGWILPHAEINHPDIWNYQGRVYLDPSDICPGTQLRKGDAVVFYLYADQYGIGAESCRLAPSQPELQSDEYAGSTSVNPLWLLADSYDDSDDEEEEQVGMALSGKGAKEKGGDSDSTTCGSRSTKSSPGEVWVDIDGSNDEESQHKLSDDEEHRDELQAELRAARAAAAGLKADTQKDDLQAELSAARAQAQTLQEDLQRDGLQAELRAARAEAGRLAADLQKENLQVELREARAQAGQLAAKLEAAGLSALELAAQAISKETAAVAKYADLPSKGSVLHASGQCRRCNFFAKGCCSKGKDCCFCHFPHEKQQDSRKAAPNHSLVNGAVKKTESQQSSKSSKRQALSAPAPQPAGVNAATLPPPGLLKVVGAPPGLECFAPMPATPSVPTCAPCGVGSMKNDVADPFETELQAELRAAREQALRLASVMK